MGIKAQPAHRRQHEAEGDDPVVDAFRRRIAHDGVTSLLAHLVFLHVVVIFLFRAVRTDADIWKTLAAKVAANRTRAEFWVSRRSSES